MTEIIQNYYDEQKAIFDEKYTIVLSSFNAEAIHKMRTTTKRLRGLFQLIQFMSTEEFSAKEQLRKIRALFKYAGRIREIQIEQWLLYGYEEKLSENFVEYHQYLLQREHKEISRFLKHIPVCDSSRVLDDDLIKGAIGSIDEMELTSKASKFIAKKEKIIYKIVQKHISNHRIHASRTILKQLYYLHEILIALSGKDKLLDITYDRMGEIEQMIGSWHDLINSSDYLNGFLKTAGGKNLKKYSVLKKFIKEQRDTMRQEIVKALQGITQF
ncbi:MAG: CHAD domain-containing protein [Bacteroidales bacterium]